MKKFILKIKEKQQLILEVILIVIYIIIIVLSLLPSSLLLLAVIWAVISPDNVDSAATLVSASILSIYIIWYVFIFSIPKCIFLDKQLLDSDAILNIKSYLSVFKPEEKIQLSLTFWLGILGFISVIFFNCKVSDNLLISFFVLSTAILLVTSSVKVFTRIKSFKSISDLVINEKLLNKLNCYIGKMNIERNQKIIKNNKSFYDKETFEKIQLLAVFIEYSSTEIDKSMKLIEKNISIQEKNDNIKDKEIENVSEYNKLGKILYKITRK